MRGVKRLFFWFCFLLLSAASVYFLLFVAALPMRTNGLAVKPTGSTAQEAEITEPEDADVANSADTSTAVQAAAEGQAKGKIVSKRYTTDGANLKYNRVYVKNTTSKTVDLRAELLAGPGLRLQKTDKPQVLLVHTHTTESYMAETRDYYTEADKSRTTNDAQNIVAVGEVLKKGLEQRGIGVIHATEKHDYPEYTGAYTRAAQTINKYLKQYPDIKVVIDLHRDSITANDGTKTAPVATIDGKQAAQVMVVAGCEDGEVSGFPNWRENFRLAIKLQQAMEAMHPGLARPILFTPRKYNQHLTTGSLLLEIGTDANSFAQADYAASLVAEALAGTLNMLKK